VLVDQSSNEPLLSSCYISEESFFMESDFGILMERHTFLCRFPMQKDPFCETFICYNPL